MVARRYKSSNNLLKGAAVVGCAAVLVVGCLGFGIVGADAQGGAAGLGASQGEAQLFSSSVNDLVVDDPSEDHILTSSVKRDMTQGIEEIAAEEEAARVAAEEAARAAEEAARVEEQARIAAAQEAKQEAAAEGADAVYLLEDVSFDCGKEAFVDEWTARINAYLIGSPLAGYGSAFAEAAWNYGVDPRWSPAISNTESSKGSVCFMPYNAWGWTGGSWSNWEEAINAHVAGLASGYGYTISLANAMKYCPPNYQNWYSNTISEMAKI